MCRVIFVFVTLLQDRHYNFSQINSHAYILKETLVYSNLIWVARLSFVEAVTDGLGMWTNMCHGGWQLMPNGEGEWSIDAFAHVHISQINLHFQHRLDKLWII